MNDAVFARRRGVIFRMLTCLLLVVFITAGCTSPNRAVGPGPGLPPGPGPGVASGFRPVGAEVNGVAVTLVRVLPPTAKQAPMGWIEYELSLANRTQNPVVVNSVKLLTATGRYLQPARAYGETQAAPNLGASVAGDVATGAAGIAAGQVVPYGGLVVTAISGLVRGSSQETQVGAEQNFRLRHVPGVELAPGGKMVGSVFFPDVNDARSLEVEVSRQGQTKSERLPLQGSSQP